MDDCVDCGRRLRDLICSSCHQIYVATVTPEMRCHNCGMQMISKVTHSKMRYKCTFCLYNYIALDEYDSDQKVKLKEYIQSLERECTDCGKLATLHPQTEELVCKHCGLVHDFPIYTEF